MTAAKQKKEQLRLALPFRGGARRGAGRKPRGERAGVPHRPRPRLSGREPVHVTLRVHGEIASLRKKRLFKAVRQAFAMQQQSDRARVDVIEFSVQANHIHLILEVPTTDALSRGVQGLCVRAARALNRLLCRRGAVFADRFHAHVLRSLREVRNAIAYVRRNRDHHLRRLGLPVPDDSDPCSSACGEVVWVERPRRAPWWLGPELLCVALSRMWLMRNAYG